MKNFYRTYYINNIYYKVMVHRGTVNTFKEEFNFNILHNFTLKLLGIDVWYATSITRPVKRFLMGIYLKNAILLGKHIYIH